MRYNPIWLLHQGAVTIVLKIQKSPPHLKLGYLHWNPNAQKMTGCFIVLIGLRFTTYIINCWKILFQGCFSPKPGYEWESWWLTHLINLIGWICERKTYLLEEEFGDVFNWETPTYRGHFWKTGNQRSRGVPQFCETQINNCFVG